MALSKSLRCIRCHRIPRILPATHYRLYSDASPNSSSSSASSTAQTAYTSPHNRPSIAPKPIINIKDIRQNPDLYIQTCLTRNYQPQAAHPQTIISLHEQWQELQKNGRALRERSNLLRKFLANPATTSDDEALASIKHLSKEEILEEARLLKTKLASIEEGETSAKKQIEDLALELPNLTSFDTPIGDEPSLLGYIGEKTPATEPPPSGKPPLSHVDIGTRLSILDFTAAATASGYGYYYLVGAAAQLEQALVQYALDLVTRYGWTQVSPPSMVYSHIGAACGFQPRDQHGEQQVYTIKQTREDVPEMCLTGTSEIALAGMKANTTIPESALPLKRVAVSRCYRAEAGGRGADTKGLYRVHEFTKVEMFAWSPPDMDISTELFDEMLDIQTEIITSLGLHARILEMPSTDLGASAARKVDMEAFFPSRVRKDDEESGWGEVTSASICTDYQSRRLATRMKMPKGSVDVNGEDISGKLGFPWTVNGTALAVPRIIAAILENGWDGEKVLIPEALRSRMGGKEFIE